MPSPLPILPLILLLVAWLVVLAIGGGRRVLLAAAVAITQTTLLVLSTILFVRTADGEVLVHFPGGWSPPQGIAFVVDPMAAFVLLVVAIVCSAAMAWFFLEKEKANPSRILALFLLLQAGVCGALLSGDLFDFYVFFELMGIASYASVAYRRSPAHLEAAWKYAVLSLCGSSFLLIGVGGVYAQTGLLTFASFRDASQLVGSKELYLFSIGLILVALALKAAIVPLHFWLPDAHAIAPTAVSVLLSGAVVNVGAYGILRVLASQAPWVWAAAADLLLFAGGLTAIACALMAAAQRDLKRLLAYSTSSQMGYVVAAAALGTRAGTAAALVTLAAHALMKSTLFFGAGLAIDTSGERRWDRMGGFIQASPLFATSMLVGCLSLAGLPPLAGFASKFTVFTAFIRTGALIPLLCVIGASLIMIWLMARVWLHIQGAPAREDLRVDPAQVRLTSVMAFLVLAAGIAMGPLVDHADRAAIELLDGSAYREAVLGSGSGASSTSSSKQQEHPPLPAPDLRPQPR